MSFDAKRLFELLPAVYRMRDAQSGGALGALVDVIAEQVACLEEDIAQLHDDAFIETCADWVVPYVGDLIGYRGVHGVAASVGSPRAEVANTIAYRRRKGTASMLEQLAHDVTGFDARVVEYFRRLATTQYLNHVRSEHRSWTSVRKNAALESIGSPFDATTRTLDVRRIARKRGRFNIPNVGLHLWRIRAFEVREAPAVKLVAADPNDRRYHWSPLGADAPLYSRAAAEKSIAHLAERANVPMPIRRRELADRLETFYPASLSIRVGGKEVPASAVAACDLSDRAGTWAYAPVESPVDEAKVHVDPVLGRLWFPATLKIGGQPVATTDPVVTFHYGFPAEMGGGRYPRAAGFATDLTHVVAVTPPSAIGGALTSLAGSGVVETQGDGRFVETFAIAPASGARVELRAADQTRATVELGGELVVDVSGGAEVTIDGLLLLGAGLRVRSSGAGGGRLRLRHCTLVPGIELAPDGSPAQPSTPSLVIESPAIAVEIDRSILGGLRAHEDATVRIASSLIDATDPTRVAYAALDGAAAGGPIEIVASTVIGKVHARVLTLVSNSILLARLADPDPWPHPIQAERRQEGCVRYSYVPPGSRTPRRHRCVPATDDDAARVQPQLVADRYGRPAYGQLDDRCAEEIRTGADDESEMGVFHDLFGPQREANLAIRLDEYLRFGLEAGVFHAS